MKYIIKMFCKFKTYLQSNYLKFTSADPSDSPFPSSKSFKQHKLGELLVRVTDFLFFLGDKYNLLSVLGSEIKITIFLQNQI